MIEKKDIRLTADEADALLDILDQVVVSLDQIGSRQASGEDPRREWLQEYFTTGGATRRLALARGIVLEAFYRVHTEDELEAKWDSSSVTYWNDAEH
ncbi:hypothetical protein GCM10022197_29760 [Microlunatus spumicola]|uniref:Uncharacterized protein n=1 Tax=Microlunatus spumicola TaxID=81499 RepID=A0ABP6XRZ1_9ACTN